MTTAQTDLLWLWDDAWLAQSEHPIEFPPAITDREWTEITEIVENARANGELQIRSLPEEARQALDTCIGFYRLTQQDSPSVFSLEIRLSIWSLHKQLLEASKTLKTLLTDGRALEAVAMGLAGDLPHTEEQKAETRQQLQRLETVLNDSCDFLNGAEERTFDGPGSRPKSGDLNELIRLIDIILIDYSGMRVSSRSLKIDPAVKIAAMVLQIADENLNPHTIDGAIRRFISPATTTSTETDDHR